MHKAVTAARLGSCQALLITFASVLNPLSAYAESVDVKYRGLVDLAPFKCESITRSSFIHRVCYDAKQSYMIIELGDTYYHYCEIDQATVNGLLAADSMGKFFNERIRGYGGTGPFDCLTHHVPNAP
jgi:KTSC domain